MEARLRASRSVPIQRRVASPTDSSNSTPSTRSAPLITYTLGRDNGTRVFRQPPGPSRSPSPPPRPSPIDDSLLPPGPGRHGGPPIIPVNCCDTGDICPCPRGFCACICNCVVCDCFCREEPDDGSLIDYSDDGDESDHENHPDDWSDAETHPDYWAEADPNSPVDGMDVDDGRGRSPPRGARGAWHKVVEAIEVPKSPSFVQSHTYPPNGTILSTFRVESQMACVVSKDRFYLCLGYQYSPVPGSAAADEAHSHKRHIFFGQPSSDCPLRERIPGVFCGWLPYSWIPAQLMSQWDLARERLPLRVRRIQDVPDHDDTKAWRLQHALVEEIAASAERLRRYHDQRGQTQGRHAILPISDQHGYSQKSCCSQGQGMSANKSMRKQARKLIKKMKEDASK